MDNKKGLVLIPARFASSRFPGKPLAQIQGKSMIERVYNNCKASMPNTYVVTDSEEIERHVMDFNGQVVRVDDEVNSGTERIFLAFQRFFSKENYELIINVQGDEPLLSGSEILRLFNFHIGNCDYGITTLVKRKVGAMGEFNDPNKVKVVYSKETHRCHYFSRAPIPFIRDKDYNLDLMSWYLHIGVYSYRPSALALFCESGVSYFENLEKLEQLRALDLGMSIGGLITEEDLIGVDSPDDLELINGVISGKDN